MTNVGGVQLAALVALLLFGTACRSRGPDEASRAWLGALAQANTVRMSELTCASQRTSLASASDLLSQMANFASPVGGATLGVDDLKYETLRDGASSAEVRVRGPLRVNSLLFSFVKEVDFTVHMEVEADQWRYCGLNVVLPELSSPQGWFSPSRWFANLAGFAFLGGVAAAILVACMGGALLILFRRSARVVLNPQSPPPRVRNASPAPKPPVRRDRNRRPQGWA